jgi:hypothetical protein
MSIGDDIPMVGSQRGIAIPANIGRISSRE